MGNNWYGLLWLCWFVFLCLHVFTARWWVVGVGAFFGLGIKSLYERTHCRVHVQHRVSVRHCVVVARMPGLRVLFLGFWVCVVGCL